MQFDYTIEGIVFDVGGVLIDWDPKYLYEKLIPDAEERKHFLENVCPYSWNLELDKHQNFKEHIEKRIAEFPEYEDLIRAYDERWIEMVKGEIEDTVKIQNALGERGYHLYAITNYNAEKFYLTRDHYDCLNRFQGIIISGEEGVLKPDPSIYYRLYDRYGLRPDSLLFIDDKYENVMAAKANGMHGLFYEDSIQLERDLSNEYGINIYG